MEKKEIERASERRICLSIDKSADGNICLLSQELLFTEIYFFLPYTLCLLLYSQFATHKIEMRIMSS